MKKKAAIIIAILLAAGVARAQRQADRLTDQVKVKQGATVYAREGCAKCHSLAGKGGNVSHPLDGVGTKLNIEEIRAVLLTPQARGGDFKPATGMPSFAKLSKADLNALIAYVSSLKRLDMPR
jgi:mono/diheme cytochrome c family protein